VTGHLDLVACARPDFVGLAPVARALSRQGRVVFRVVHTGRHDDDSLGDAFFKELGIPRPDAHLEVGPGAHGAQTGRILERYEMRVLEQWPAATVVFGDFNGAVACALAAAKQGVRVAHVEAGLRCFDRSMPEEINRLLADAVGELLLVSEESGVLNLRGEGVLDSRVSLVGNPRIDLLRERLPAAREQRLAEVMGLREREYGLVTLHRSRNVDDAKTLANLLELLHQLSAEVPLVFPIHPYTREAARKAGIEERLRSSQGRLLCFGQFSYLDTLSLLASAAVVLTDSGALQDESSAAGIPCLTLRENTERPVTLSLGTNRLVGTDPARIRRGFVSALRGDGPRAQEIPLWDGKAGERIATRLGAWLGA
jgi:UDP-N-acetylglucosamine 2-epimerase (non-hydrolysing)